MLAQRKNDKLRPVRYASRSFTPTESRMPTAHQELFAVKWALEHFCPYLMGSKFKLITDHANLKFLSSIAPQNSKLARWCLSWQNSISRLNTAPVKVTLYRILLSRAPLPLPSVAADMLLIR